MALKEFKPSHVRHDDYQVTCPYCGFEPDETYPSPGGNSDVEECGRCEKTYYASAETVYSSRRDCKLNKMECDWKPDESMNLFSDRKRDWLRCPNCLDTRSVVR